MRTFSQIVQRELAIHKARKSEWLSVLLFYVIVVSLFPIALGAWPSETTWFAPIIIWIGVLIATVLSQENMLRADFKFGVFDHVLLSKYSFSLLLLGKILAHWVVYSVPLILLTPLLAISFSLPAISVFTITASLLLGTLFLSLIAALGAAITVRLARGGVFLAMLILPIYIPVLILGSNIGIMSVHGIVSKGHFALLAALVVMALLCVPLAVAAAIRISME